MLGHIQHRYAGFMPKDGLADRDNGGRGAPIKFKRTSKHKGHVFSQTVAAWPHNQLVTNVTRRAVKINVDHIAHAES